MSNKTTKELDNETIAIRAGTMKGKFVRVAVGEKSAHLTHRSQTIKLGRGTKGYAKALKWVTKRLGK